ncbi:hypothetical protein [Micromonospora sp. WMMD1082]|uniref:hypothetical protein n=1 Tax=Micromonospora sp. WMMD1082 TaxID=3016104 RepID=UPI0024180FD8|nr:hypothetical protein [Micromonospora sp. WMMD1082]MDG4792686.1 hypothetical protein [Micromonospora sp. WMMD1082]
MSLTPEEALTKGREYVARFGPFGDPSEHASRALEVATFLLDYDTPAPADDPEPGPLGPKRTVSCADTPADKATVQGGMSTAHGPAVRLSVHGPNGGGLVILTPDDARRFAAGLLDAADEADGGAGRLMFGLDDLPTPS